MATPGTKHPRVTRVDRPNTRLEGWLVEVWQEGRRIRRYFSDLRLGGRRRAHAAARQFALGVGDRSEFLPLLRRLKPRKNSRSGIPGVSRYEGQGRGPFWLAYWDENGRKIQRKFSVSIHGEERARALAIKARRNAVKEHVKRLAQLRKHDAPILRALTKGHPQQLSGP
jgi:hypothetical protein